MDDVSEGVNEEEEERRHSGEEHGGAGVGVDESVKVQQEI